MQQREFHLSISDPSASFPTSGSLLAMPETSADGKDPYELAPLNLCDKCIRLVEVCAFTTTKKIRCRLRSYTLETDCPLYIALSYKWGPNERYDDVELNDSLFPVGRNLWMFPCSPDALTANPDCSGSTLSVLTNRTTEKETIRSR